VKTSTSQPTVLTDADFDALKYSASTPLGYSQGRRTQATSPAGNPNADIRAVNEAVRVNSGLLFAALARPQAGFEWQQTPIKYTPPGGRVEINADARPGEVSITVKDNGEGIPPEEVPRIWERLYRGDKSRAQRGLEPGSSPHQGPRQNGHARKLTGPGFEVHSPSPFKQ
jgi:hypothetical protein